MIRSPKKQTKLSHRRILETCLAGDVPEAVPVSLWRHFPVDDQYAEQLARSVIDFQKLFDFDFVKITPASSFCTKDWGVVDAWKGNPEGTREYTHHPIKNPEDWTKLPGLNPKKGNLAQQLTCIKLIQKEISKDTPILQTVFSPMSQAKNLAGKELLLEHVRKFPEALLEGLKRIHETNLNFLKECKNFGIDGVFYAMQYGQKKLLSQSEFMDFEKKWANDFLLESEELFLNILHLHGESVYFEEAADLPVQAINWHDRQGQPDLQTGKTIFPGVVCGGVRQIETLTLGTPLKLETEIHDAFKQTSGSRFILGTGCVSPIIAPLGNIRSLVSIARSLRV